MLNKHLPNNSMNENEAVCHLLSTFVLMLLYLPGICVVSTLHQTLQGNQCHTTRVSQYPIHGPKVVHLERPRSRRL